MRSVIKDFTETKKIIDEDRVSSAEYDKVYFHSNEFLSDICSVVDFNDKEVLSVLGSGDQMFHFYNSGAKRVDCVDINRLVKYSTYLRIWSIIHNGIFYPDFTNMNGFVNETLKSVKPSNIDEEDAYKYWEACIHCFSNDDLIRLFSSVEFDKNNNISDLSNLSKILGQKKFHFMQCDLGKEMNAFKKYDIVYTSNARDYLKGNFESYHYNMNNLLKKDGIMVCANVLREGPSKREKMIFEKNFELSDIYSSDNKYIGYCYTKKRKN